MTSGPGVSRAKPFTRALIAGDREVRPYELSGPKRTLFLTIYAAILGSAAIGMAYTFYVAPWFGAAALTLGYLFDNLAFSYWHFEFHTEFIEVPETRMSTLCHNSFIHHYRNRGAYHEHWLETRMSYFMDPQMRPTLGSLAKINPIFLLIAVLCYFAHPVVGIALYAAQAVPLLVQSVVHEWYHNPPRNRRSFYSPPAYWFLTLLEKTGLASTRDHMIHHQHDLDSLDLVDKWLDLYIPLGERLPSRLWRKALSLYKPGETRMNDFARRPGAVRILIGDRFLAVAAIMASYFLLAP